MRVSQVPRTLPPIGFLIPLMVSLAERMSKMEEEAGKYTEEQLAEIMLEFSGILTLCLIAKSIQARC